jgi:hypothetical protein
MVWLPLHEMEGAGGVGRLKRDFLKILINQGLTTIRISCSEIAILQAVKLTKV